MSGSTRRLGSSGPEVSAIGLGCWAIGGPARARVAGGYEGPIGYGAVDDSESIRAVRAAITLGCTFFDTASNYGGGHSEEVLGEALRQGRDRDDVIVATKAGSVVDADGVFTGSTADPLELRRSCEASLRRLGTDYVDVLQLHWGDCPADAVDDVFGLFEELVVEGKVRWYGWSTDLVDRAEAMVALPADRRRHLVAVQHVLNLLDDHERMVDLCARHGLASIAKAPLSSGLLAGRITASTTFDPDDSRSNWDLSSDGARALLDAGAALRAAFGEMGRTAAQGALGWVLARAPHAVPIPGFRTVAQVEDNLGALALGPLSLEEVASVEALIASRGVRAPQR